MEILEGIEVAMQAEVLVEFTKGYVGIAMGVVQGVVEIQKQVFLFHKYNLKRRRQKGESRKQKGESRKEKAERRKEKGERRNSFLCNSTFFH